VTSGFSARKLFSPTPRTFIRSSIFLRTMVSSMFMLVESRCAHGQRLPLGRIERRSAVGTTATISTGTKLTDLALVNWRAIQGAASVSTRGPGVSCCWSTSGHGRDVLTLLRQEGRVAAYHSAAQDRATTRRFPARCR
jgi:hypothetical protein